MNNWIEEDKKCPAINTVVIITDGVNVSCGWLRKENGKLLWVMLAVIQIIILTNCTEI